MRSEVLEYKSNLKEFIRNLHSDGILVNSTSSAGISLGVRPANERRCYTVTGRIPRLIHASVTGV